MSLSYLHVGLKGMQGRNEDFAAYLYRLSTAKDATDASRERRMKTQFRSSYQYR